MKSISEQQIEAQVQIANLQSSMDAYAEKTMNSYAQTLRSAGVPEDLIYEYKINLGLVMVNYGNFCIQLGGLLKTYDYEIDSIIKNQKKRKSVFIKIFQFFKWKKYKSC